MLYRLQAPKPAPPAQRLLRVGGIVHLQPARFLAAESQRSAVAVQLELDVVHRAGTHAADLHQPRYAAGHAQVQQRQVVHLHRGLLAAPGRHRTPRYQGLQQRLRRAELAQQEAHQVQHVGAEVMQRSAAGVLPAQAPRQRPSGVDVAGAVVARAEREHASQEPFLHELSRAGDGREEAEVEAHLRRDPGRLHGGQHAPPLGDGACQRFLAVHVLARGGRGHHHLLVAVVRHAAVDHIDVVTVQQLAIVGAGRRAAELPCRAGSAFLMRGGNSGHPYCVRVQGVVQRDGAVPQRVDAADAAVPHQADAQRSSRRHHSPTSQTR